MARHIQFMKARFFGVTVSALLSIASVVLFIHPGLNYGVDFRGGIQMSVKTQEASELGRFREGLEQPWPRRSLPPILRRQQHDGGARAEAGRR